jgi:hypothetical protein
MADTSRPTRLTGVRDGAVIVVYFGDNITLQDAGFTGVVVTIGSDPAQTYLLSAGAGGDSTWKYFRFTITAQKFPNAHNGDIVQVQVSAANGSTTTESLRYVETWVPYGLGASRTVLWFPVGLFSTDFKSNSSGVTLASMPVGAALGAKFYIPGYVLPDQFYVGLSAIGSWLISSAKDSTGAATGNLSFAGITAGALVDFNNWFYLGYAYGWDLTSNHDNPGNMFVVGVAPGLLQLVKSKP